MFLTLVLLSAVWIFFLAKKANQKPFLWAFLAFLVSVIAQFVFAFIGGVVFILNYGITTPEDVTQKFTEMVEANSVSYVIFSTFFSLLPIWMMARNLTSRADKQPDDFQ